MTIPDLSKCPAHANQSSNYTFVFKEAPQQNIVLMLVAIVTEWLSRLSIKSIKNVWFMAKHKNIHEMFYLAWQKKDMISKCRTLAGTIYVTADPDIMKAVLQHPKTHSEGIFLNKHEADQFLKIMTLIFPEDVARLGLDKIINMIIMTANPDHIKELRSPLINLLATGPIKESMQQLNQISEDIFESLTDLEKMNCDVEKLGFEFVVTFASKFITGYDTTRENYRALAHAFRIVWNSISYKSPDKKEQEEYQQAILTIKTVIDSNISAPHPSLLITQMTELGWDNFQIRSLLFFIYLPGAQPIASSINILLSQLGKVQNKHVIEKLRDPIHRESYVSQVIAETLRLHPVLLLPMRQFRNNTIFDSL